MNVTSKDGTTIAVDRVGSGPAVVCVGGGLNDRNSTADVAARLTGHTAYSYDRRGRGDSGDNQPYAVDREIEDLAAVVEAAGGSVGGAVMVYGMSSGAVLALRAAAAGVPITRLALFEPPLRGVVATAPPPPPDYAARLEQFVAAGDPAGALELFLVEAMGMPAHVVAGMKQAPMWPALVALAPTLRYDAAVLDDERIPEVTVPVTVLTGTASPGWLRDTGRVLAAALPAGTHVELPDQTHNVAPAVLAEALVRAFA